MDDSSSGVVISVRICSWNDEIKEDEMGRACSTHGEKRTVYRVLVGKPKERDQ
jgi:hypothetical protein